MPPCRCCQHFFQAMDAILGAASFCRRRWASSSTTRKTTLKPKSRQWPWQRMKGRAHEFFRRAAGLARHSGLAPHT